MVLDLDPNSWIMFSNFQLLGLAPNFWVLILSFRFSSQFLSIVPVKSFNYFFSHFNIHNLYRHHSYFPILQI